MADSPYGGTLTGQRQGDTVTIELDGAPAQTQVRVLAGERPVEVRIDGQVVEEVDVETLNGSRGWTYVTGRQQGVLLKLAPQGGDATVEITLA